MKGLSYQDLDAIAISAGPGSYTSLRIGASVAKGLCFALDKPLIAVPTLLALGRAAIEHEQLHRPDGHFIALPMIDARRDEVCMAVVNSDTEKKLDFFPNFVSNRMFENIQNAGHTLPPDAVYILAGNGAKKWSSVHFEKKVVFSALQTCSAEHLAPLAEQLFHLVDFQLVANFEPIYFKPPMVTQPKKIIF